MSFKAFRIHQQEKGVSTGFENLEVDQLTQGEVVVRVAYSGINFKDALAATGKAKILESRAVERWDRFRRRCGVQRKRCL